MKWKQKTKQKTHKKTVAQVNEQNWSMRINGGEAAHIAVYCVDDDGDLGMEMK